MSEEKQEIIEGYIIDGMFYTKKDIIILRILAIFFIISIIFSFIVSFIIALEQTNPPYSTCWGANLCIVSGQGILFGFLIVLNFALLLCIFASIFWFIATLLSYYFGCLPRRMFGNLKL